MKSIDLNCDVGEGVGCERDLFPLVSSANVACGGHAGDEETMVQTLCLADDLGVLVGAHPGFPDRGNFGRVELRLSPEELAASMRDQLAALRKHGEFHYVKPHGALYNLAARDRGVARTLVTAFQEFDRALGIMALVGSELWIEARARGLSVAGEAFADRGYDPSGRLIARGQPGAIIEDHATAVQQVLTLVHEQRVRSLDGTWIEIEADSICLHGDNEQAVAFARRIRAALADSGVEVKSFWRNF